MSPSPAAALPEALVAERPGRAPALQAMERGMHPSPFSEFSFVMSEIADSQRQLTETAASMDFTIGKTREIIAGSRELMAKADRLMAKK